MDLIFLGTGAAEAIPCVFCRCAICGEARRRGGKDVRTRASFRIDAKHQIDFSPDVFQQMTRLGLDLFELEHLLITHTHEDHFDLAEIIAREMAFPVIDRPMYIYMNRHAADWARSLLRSYLPGVGDGVVAGYLDTYRLVPTDYFETFRAGGLEVTSLKANHRAYGEDEYAQNYIVRLPDGRRLLYALDTGWYGEDTWEFLRGRKVDILIMDCTFGGDASRDIHPGGHLDVRSMLAMLEKMEAIGLIDGKSMLYATHINHKHDLPHEGMQRAFDASAYRVTVAWDGLAVP